MAQSDYVIDNQSFPATRSDLNSLFQAIASCNSGATAPSTTYANQLWYDTSVNKLYIRNEDNDAWIELFVLDQTGDHLEKIGDTITLDGTGKAGIGTSSISGKLTLGGDDAFEAITLRDNTASADMFSITSAEYSGGGGNPNKFTATNSSVISFETGGSETARLDASNNLLVGKTSNDFATSGFVANANGIGVTRSGAACVQINRTSSDGNIQEFYKDGTLFGSIQSSGGVNLIVQGASAVVFKVSATEIAYFDSVGLKPWVNNTYDLGSASSRWRDIYTDGAVNTSDQNKKQQIEALTTSEIAAAKRISALFKKFKWNDAVAEKGDAARTHVGIIAQDVKSALEAEGLDATKYAFWCSNTWWETQTEVPAVEADEENGIEAQAAYTRTDIYDTADEAPEGAVERTLQSVRYAELMAFVGAATEQRLTSIEARLTALEA